jgi:hypothetical protein
VKVSLTAAGTARVLEALDLRGTSFFARTRDWSVEDVAKFTSLLHAFNAPIETE